MTDELKKALLEGCLNSDNIHPTQNGARLLVHELLNKVGYLVD